MSISLPQIVRVEYLIVIRRSAGLSGLEISKRALVSALEAHWQEDAVDQAQEFIQEEFQRITGFVDPVTGEVTGSILYGFQIELPKEVPSPVSIIRDFTIALRDDEDIQHVLKFYDSLLEIQNLKFSCELFSLEMRLRRAISLIYLASGHNYYDLLRIDHLGNNTELRKRLPKSDELQEKSENELFYLFFGNYGNLNKLRETRQLDDLIKLIGSCTDFAMLQSELQRQPVPDVDDQVFLTRIKTNLQPAEDLRNCIMHNRTPTDGEMRSYETSRDALHKVMDELFERWTISSANDSSSNSNPSTEEQT